MNRPGAVASGRFIVLWGSAFVRPPQKEAAPTPGGRRAARDRNPSSRIPDWRHPYWLRSTAAYKCGPTAGNRLAGLPATSPARSRTSTASRSFGRHGGRRRTSGHPPSTRPTTRECVISAGKEPIRLPIRHEHPTARRPGAPGQMAQNRPATTDARGGSAYLMHKHSAAEQSGSCLRSESRKPTSTRISTSRECRRRHLLSLRVGSGCW